jgi:hypothetical protein
MLASLIFGALGLFLTYLFIVSAVKRGVKEAMREMEEGQEMSQSEALWAYVQARVRGAKPPI